MIITAAVWHDFLNLYSTIIFFTDRLMNQYTGKAASCPNLKFWVYLTRLAPPPQLAKIKVHSTLINWLNCNSRSPYQTKRTCSDLTQPWQAFLPFFTKKRIFIIWSKYVDSNMSSKYVFHEENVFRFEKTHFFG